MCEVWQDVYKFESYQVSSLGRVKRKSNFKEYSFTRRDNGKLRTEKRYKKMNEKILKPKDKYGNIDLFKNGVPFRFRIKQLVDFHFNN